MNVNQLSRAEMKAIVGGVHDCQCGCYNQVGAWHGTYDSAGGAYNAIMSHCREGGVCYCDVAQSA